jgi:hypothetical protein
MERDLVFSSGVDRLAVSLLDYLLGTVLLVIISLDGLKNSKKSDSKATSMFLSFSFVARYIGAPASKSGKTDDHPAVLLQSTWIRILKLYSQWIDGGRIVLPQGQRVRNG